MKRNILAALLLAAFTSPALAQVDECVKADELRFIREGDAVSELISRAGEPDHADIKEYREIDTYSYFPVCGNQTIYIFKIRNGAVIHIERQIQR